MRKEQEIKDMIVETTKLLKNTKTKLKEINRKSKSKKQILELELKKSIPLIVAINILIERQQTLFWSLGKPIKVKKFNKLSKNTFRLLEKRLETLRKSW